VAVPGQGGSGQGVGGVSAVGFTHTGDAHPEADIVSLSLRMRDVITCFWCGLLDEDQVSALWDGGGEGSAQVLMQVGYMRITLAVCSLDANENVNTSITA